MFAKREPMRGTKEIWHDIKAHARKDDDYFYTGEQSRMKKNNNNNFSANFTLIFRQV